MKKTNTLILIKLIYFVAALFVLSLCDFGIEHAVLMSLCVAVFLYCVFRGLNEHYVLNPYLLFSLTPLSLILYLEKVSPYYLVALDKSTWILALINFGCFIAGLNIDCNLGDDSTSDDSIKNVDADIYNDRRLVLDSIVFIILGRIHLVYKILIGCVMPLASVFKLFAYCSLMCAMKSKKRPMIVLILALVCSEFLVDFRKTDFIFVIITLFIALEKYYVQNKKEQLLLVILTFTAALTMVFVAFPLKNFVESGGDFFEFFDSGNEKFNELFGKRIVFNGPSVLRMPYMYFVSAWTNVQYIMQTQNTRTYGLWMIKPLIGYFQLDSLFGDTYMIYPYSSFNTFTYITVLFKDFGYWGSGIGSIILGLFAKWVYRRFKSTDDALDSACYAMCAIAVLEMFFSNHFYELSYPFTIIIISFIYRKLSMKFFTNR